MRRRGRLTIRDVAEAAGVSSQTVSRVLNNHPDVAPDTFERVERVIATMGYAPNMLARSLTQGRTHTLGVVGSGLDYYGPSRIVTGIERQAASMGYSITLSLVHEPSTGDVQDVLRTLLGRQVDGVIWAVPEVGDNRAWFRNEDLRLAVPGVLVGGMAGPCLSWVGIDNRAIGRLATEHLIAGGARRIATITGPLDWWESQQRRDGWRETLETHGLEASDARVVEGDWSPASGVDGLLRLLERAPDIDAVFAANDQMALGALHAAHSRGRRVPEDISVVGVDDIPEASHFWPSLTSVYQPVADAGEAAVRELDGLIARGAERRRPVDPVPPGRTVLAPTLVPRESSRRPG